MFHISEEILNNQDRVDPVLLDAVSRMGGSWYSQSKKGLFELKKISGLKLLNLGP